MKLIWLGLLLAGCNNVVSKEAPAETPVVLDYAHVRKVFFEPYCIRCHGLAGDYSLETKESTLTRVVLGDAMKSTLFRRVLDGDMPPKGAKPTAEEIELLAQWIDEGAI